MTCVPAYGDDEHAAYAYRTRDGWQRWHAYCPCGWRWNGTGGREDAQRAAREHDGEKLEHTCYDPQTMEYDPGPCAACLGEAVHQPPTARAIGEYLASYLPPDGDDDGPEAI